MSDINFLLHSSTKDQRDYAKEIANDGVITYSLSDSHSDIHANWFKRIFEHINNLTGLEFEKKSSNAEINYSMTISPISLNQFYQNGLGYHSDTIKKIDKANYSYIINHKEMQYGGVSSQCETTRVILRSLGLSHPEGYPNDSKYTYNDSILSYKSVNSMQAGRLISTTPNDQDALKQIFGTNQNFSTEEKFHNTELNEDLLIGSNGRIDYFILNRKGCYTGSDAAVNWEEGYARNDDYINASISNFNPDEGDKILISRKLLSPYGDGFPTDSEKIQTKNCIKG